MNNSKQKQERLTPEQKWEQATLANNFIFYKVMRHQTRCLCKRHKQNVRY